MLFTALFWWSCTYSGMWLENSQHKNMIQKIFYSIAIFIKWIYFIEVFAQNYLFQVTTTLKFEADISIRCMLLILLNVGDTVSKHLLQVPAKNLKLILTHNKPFSPVPANICLVAVIHPCPVAMETWLPWTPFLSGAEKGELEEISVQYGL